MKEKKEKNMVPPPRNHVALALFKRQTGAGAHRKPEKALRRQAKSRAHDLYSLQGG